MLYHVPKTVLREKLARFRELCFEELAEEIAYYCWSITELRELGNEETADWLHQKTEEFFQKSPETVRDRVIQLTDEYEEE